MAKKRGASMSTCGLSNDHYQDILRQDPAHILLLLQLCNLIVIGTLTDGPARTLLLNGKVTALVKNITDVRPIVTVHPPVSVPSVGRNSSWDFQQGMKQLLTIFAVISNLISH
jgi:hypothetical protein